MFGFSIDEVIIPVDSNLVLTSETVFPRSSPLVSWPQWVKAIFNALFM